MQGTHIFRRDWTTQLIKCTLWNTRLCPHLTIIKKMKTFLEVEGKMDQIPTSQFRSPLHRYQPPTSGRTMLQRGEREQHPRDAGPQLQSLPPHICLYQRPHQNPKLMFQIADPQLQFQFVSALHGLVQAKC